MAQYGFYFDNSRCTGCHTCELACKDYNDLDQTLALRKVYDYEGGETTAAADGSVTTTAYGYHVSTACNHCTAPACVEACPTGAMQKDADTGIVWTDHEVCIGCESCVKACPYGAPVLDEVTKYTVKCDLCKSRVTAGKQPICVESCPLRALEFGDIEELRAAHPDAVDAIAPLPDPAQTAPNVCILAGPAAQKWDDTAGMVANEKEVTGVLAWA
ncbi:MAG: 4Fe-4S binding protein [Eggerthellaceae bacterium]|nr:4Fe-4S binding protein [Eggerthellaceae bacterium]